MELLIPGNGTLSETTAGEYLIPGDGTIQVVVAHVPVTVTKTIGSDVSRDYATVSAWAADLDDSGIYGLGDTAIGEMYNDSVFEIDDEIDLNLGDTIGLVSITLRAAQSDRHEGRAGTGVRIKASDAWSGGATAKLINVFQTSGIPVHLEWIEFDANAKGIHHIVEIVPGSAPSGPCSFKNCLAYNSLSTQAAVKTTGFTAEFETHFLNNIIYRIRNTGGGQVFGIWASGGATVDYQYLNNTVHDIYANSTSDCVGIRFHDDVDHIVKNNISTDIVNDGSGAANDFYSISGNATANNNLSSDTTAPGTSSLTSKAAADQFNNISVGSENLHLKSSADAIDAGADLGTTPSGVEIDIDGRDRDAEADTWDIGADEFVQPKLLTLLGVGK